MIAAFSFTAMGQKGKAKVRYGKVCGDPTVKCRGWDKPDDQPYELGFDMGKNLVIYESEQFYGIVLKSVKLKDFGDCQKPSFKESERAKIQMDFEHNKVFMLNCFESGSNYYTGVSDKMAFVGVYAGRTLAEASKFLATVQGLNKYPGIRLRKMRIGINGT